MQEEIGYKVITKNRYSALLQYSVGKVKYEKGVTTKPLLHCGPLCVFESFEYASLFMQRYNRQTLTIVKCKYKKSLTEYVYINAKSGARYHIGHLPYNTVLADSVTCLE